MDFRFCGNDQERLSDLPFGARADAGTGVELSAPVKRHLGLDAERSWVITTELNRFIWPGPDIRLAPGHDTPLYGEIPAKLFEQLRHAISEHAETHRMRIPKRTE